MLPFIPDIVYKRSDIHDQYKLNRRSGISYSAESPYIFIFSGESGKQHGYTDGWINSQVFSYSGEGQIGDMQLSKGNLAVLNHRQDGKSLYLFEYVRKAHVKFISELEVYDFDYFEVVDREGKMRKGIKFFFKRKGIDLPAYAKKLTLEKFEEPSLAYQVDVPTVKQRLVNTRIGQGAYRKQIILRWECECAVTGFQKDQILIASHIVPWRRAQDDERLDVNNGILLSPTYDALFDRNLISFENSGKIILSDEIERQAYKKIGVTGFEKISKLNTGNHEYLEKHRGQLVPRQIN